MRPLILVLIGLWMAAPALGQVVPDTLRPPPAVADSLVLFGWSVDADDEFAVVGAWEVRPGALGLQSDPKGTAFVYRLTDDGPVYDGRLLSDRLYIQDCFSMGLDVRDSVIAVGARCDYDGTSYGAVYLYGRDGDGWHREAKLRRDDVVGPYRPRLIGSTVALGDGYVVVGAGYTPNPADSTETQSGVVVIYEQQGADWVQTDILVGDRDSSLRNERFGASVAVVESEGVEAIIVSATLEPGLTSMMRGAIYVFERVAGVWTQQGRLYCDGPWPGYTNVCGTQLSAGIDGAVVGSETGMQPLDRVNGVWQLGPVLTLPGNVYPLGVARRGDEILAVGPPSGPIGAPAVAPVGVFTRGATGWTRQDTTTPYFGFYQDPLVSMNASHRFIGQPFPDAPPGVQNLVLMVPRVGAVATSPAAPAPLDGLAVRVGPNPTTGVATVRIDLPTDGPVTLDVVDLQGRVVWRGGTVSAPAGEHTRQVDLRGVAAGTYVVRVTTATQSGRAVLVTQ